MTNTFAIKQDDGSWGPCDAELNEWLDRVALRAGGGQPHTMIRFNEHGEAEVIAGAAYQVLYLALMAMDARLRPERGYRERADELYAVLAGGFEDGIQELRRIFDLGAPGPWPMK